MLDAVRNAVVDQKLGDLESRMADLGRSFRSLVANPEGLEKMDPKAAWTLLNGMQATLQGAEQTLRATRAFELQGPARQLVADAAHAVNGLRELLDRDVVPYAEKVYGFPSADTRWEIRRKGE